MLPENKHPTFRMVYLHKLEKQAFGIFFSLLFLFFFVTIARGQTKPQKGFLEQLDQLSTQIEQGISDSNTQIEKGDYFQAEESINRIIAGLDVLIEVFMPLQERIKKLLESEKNILDKTDRIKHQDKNRYSKELKQNQQDLVMDQIKNREQTGKAVKLTKQQIDSAGKKDQKIKQGGAENKKELIKTLKEIRILLENAKKLQTGAVSFLEDFQYKSAISEEKRAIDKLKEALKKLNKQTQQQAKNSQPDNKKQNKSENQNSKQKESPQKQSQNQEKRDSSKKAAKKKISSKEALKELSKLRKKAEDEKKRRRKKYGEASITGQIPVEKDW